MKADSLSKLASSAKTAGRQVFIEELSSPSIEEGEVMPIVEEPSWMDQILKYLTNGELPLDRQEAKRVKYKAARYALINDQLYKRSFVLPYLRCLRPSEANYAMREVHEGICGNHLGGRSLAYKLLRQGYYWPTMTRDTMEFVRTCDRCQRAARIVHQPAAAMTAISSPWPFAQWGMDILGPLPSSHQKKFLIVAVDYFTKWLEAEPLIKITEQECENFVWKSIICRFGIPHALITDNGKQFDCSEFNQFCSNLGINHKTTSVAYPQSNGLAEVTNRNILEVLQKRLSRAHGRWVDELQTMLWAYRTTSKTPTGETPFKLAFGMEAVIPVEVGLPSWRTQQFDSEANNDHIRGELDFLEESRELAQIRMAAYQDRIAKYYNSRVKVRIFIEGDLVLRKAEITQRQPRAGKLAVNWEGPYRVKEVVRAGTYRLERLDGTPLPRTWNSENLRVYYQ